MKSHNRKHSFHMNQHKSYQLRETNFKPFLIRFRPIPLTTVRYLGRFLFRNLPSHPHPLRSYQAILTTLTCFYNQKVICITHIFIQKPAERQKKLSSTVLKTLYESYPFRHNPVLYLHINIYIYKIIPSNQNHSVVS